MVFLHCVCCLLVHLNTSVRSKAGIKYPRSMWLLLKVADRKVHGSALEVESRATRAAKHMKHFLYNNNDT